MSKYRLTNDSSPDELDSDDETLRAGNHKSSGSHSNEWLVNIADDVVVPMVTTEVIEALRAGRLSNRSLVWRIGMHDWSPLAEVPHLRLAAGPSALPSAASTPGPIVVKKPAKPSAEQRRRNTLPMGFPAVRDAASVQQPAGLSAPPPSTPRSSPSKREDSSDALAVYERATPSLTFADSVRAEWQGTARIINQTEPRAAHSPAPRRLTPVPAVAARLPARVVRSAPSNTLSPTTAEAEIAAPARGAGAWGDRSVVLASELRAVKKTSKRVAVWAAAASALVASVFTFWASRASVPSFRPAQMSAPAAAVAPGPTPAKLEAAPAAASALPVAASSASATATAPTAATVALSTPKPVAVVQAVRVVKRAKPAKPAAEPTTPSTDNPYSDDAPSDSKPSEAKAGASEAPASEAKPATAAALAAAIATAVQGTATPAPIAAPVAASPGPASAATPGF
jgi:hypothetical protein